MSRSKKTSSSVTKLYGILNDNPCISKHTTFISNSNTNNYQNICNKGDLIHKLANEIIKKSYPISNLDKKLDEYLNQYNNIKLTPFELLEAKNFLTSHIYNSYKDYECKKTEEPISFSNGLINGQIDLIINDKIIVDYKTGKIDKSNIEKYSFQLKIYSAIYSTKIESAYILQLNGMKHHVNLDGSNELLSSLKNKIDTINKTKEFTYNASSQNCQYCQYQKKCDTFWRAVKNEKDEFFERFLLGQITLIQNFPLGRKKIHLATGEKIIVDKKYTNKILGINEGDSYKFINVYKKEDKKYQFGAYSEKIKI